MSKESSLLDQVKEFDTNAGKHEGDKNLQWQQQQSVEKPKKQENTGFVEKK